VISIECRQARPGAGTIGYRHLAQNRIAPRFSSLEGNSELAILFATII
jgi:hypothetical protein